MIWNGKIGKVSLAVFDSQRIVADGPDVSGPSRFCKRAWAGPGGTVHIGTGFRYCRSLSIRQLRHVRPATTAGHAIMDVARCILRINWWLRFVVGF